MSRARALAVLAVSGALLAACGGDGSDPGAPGAAASSGDVAIENFQFKPETVTVPAGTTVTWTNRDDAPHTVRGENGSFAESPTLNQGGVFTHTFGTAGRFPYICGIHNYMRATVVVT